MVQSKCRVLCAVLAVARARGRGRQVLLLPFQPLQSMSTSIETSGHHSVGSDTSPRDLFTVRVVQ